MTSSTPGSRRPALVLLGPLVLAAGTAAAARVDAGLADAARHDGRVDALIVLPDQATPPLAALAPDADYKAHRRALVDALRTRADTQQQPLRTWLQARGIDFQPFWIVNLVHARLSADDVAALAARADVARVAANPVIRGRLPARSTSTGVTPDGAATIAWGVDQVNAPLVWAAGFNGQGVVIGGEDTGYQWDHPALKPQYRGWNGTTANHNYSWHDAIHVPNDSCPANSPAPCDDYGHGTHTAGTFAGDDGGSHQIGVAPGAKWIGCRNMNAGNGTPASYIECMQWMLAPTNLQDRHPNPDAAPDVISNSWTCPASEGCTVGNELVQAVTTLTNAGILYVAAAANSGPACSTITDPPAIYAASFVVGATDSTDTLASFSSRGPVLKDPRTGRTQVKPDVSAPGVAIYSAWPPNTYTILDGTSMATPHVTGAAALLMSAVPALKGHPTVVARLLKLTAATSVTDPVDQACGGTTRTTFPNNMAGYGRIDAYAAYLAATSGVLGSTDAR
jgi:subtilisin family serine protease